MKGWLLDTNVVVALISPRGAPSVKDWASVHDENMFYIGEYDKAYHNLPDHHAVRPRYIAARVALGERFGIRVLSLDDETVRRWGRNSGEVKRASGHPPPVIDALLAATATEHAQPLKCTLRCSLIRDPSVSLRKKLFEIVDRSHEPDVEIDDRLPA